MSAESSMSRPFEPGFVFEAKRYAVRFFVTLSSLFFALTAPPSLANIYMPNAKLAGETVRVQLLKDTAVVAAVFEFEEWVTRDAKIIYFPMFADAAVTPLQLLAKAGLELEIDGRKVGPAAPCQAPSRFENTAKDRRVLWFAAHIDDLVDDASVAIGQRIVIKARYSQPLIGGHFFYLPVIVGQGEAREKRSWRYQMQVQSSTRVSQMISKGTDYEQLSEGLVVYLKDGEVVEVR